MNHKIKVYDEKSGKGLIRHIVTKIGIKTNEVMCIIVINGNELPYEDILVNELTHKFENIKSIIKNINAKNTNVILGNVGRDAVSVKIRKALSRHFDFEADFKGDFS